MPIEIVMPSLSDTMTEGDLVAWLVPEGARVARGQIIAEIETDKSTVQLEAPEAGTLSKILIREGSESVAVGETLALLSEDGDAALEEPDTRASEPVEPRPEAPPSDERATPLARAMAVQAGIQLADVRGSGVGGRITRDDVERALGTEAAPPKTVAPLPGPTPRAAHFVSGPLSRTRKTIAERLSEAKRTIPHFYLQVDCAMDRLLQLRADTNRLRPEQHLSVNDFVIMALARALARVPGANASYRDGKVQYHERVDLSVAVATERGLMTPVIRDVNSLTLAQISSEARRLAETARAGKLSPDDYTGGSFTLSNLGMYEVDGLYAIINPPQTAILGIGRARETAVVREGELAVGRLATLTISADHRVIDGALAAELLGGVKHDLEDPLGLLLWP
jgi:pyruvate dehydrogenase E2 component (dihydrolipoamide acetyltransferase)